MGFAPPGAAAGRRRAARSLLRSAAAAGLAVAVLLTATPAHAQPAPARPLLAEPLPARPLPARPVPALPALPAPARPVPALPAQPAQSPSTDLSIDLTNKTDAAAGKRITYQVVVHNHGPLTASRVQIDFTTTAALDSVTYNIDNGHCYRSPKETACLFWSPLRPGSNASVSISGVMPRKIAQGTVVSNQVTLASSTPLSHTADDKATDVYRMGTPRPVTSHGVVLPPPSPTAVNPTSKLAKFTNAASKWIGWATNAVTWVFIVLAAAIAWFAIGLWMHRRKRLARGDDDDLYYADTDAEADHERDHEPGREPGHEGGAAQDANEPDRVGS